MTLRIGVIGTGAIGQEHIKRISERLTGGKIVAVTDINLDSAVKVAEKYGARVENSDDDLINAKDIDAVIVTSWGGAHESSVLKAIKAKKPCFCEKPLADSAAGCRRIVDAEIASGKHLVQVGFMRRYDQGYKQLKEVLASKELGEVLAFHCAHRNYEVDDSFHTSHCVTEGAIHEIDVMHWLSDDYYVSAQVIFAKKSKQSHDKLIDPQIMILKTKSGVIIELEMYAHTGFVYDIQCEATCENGLVKMPELPDVYKVTDGTRQKPLCVSWKGRFIKAYDTELQEWIVSTQKGEVNGPTAWDGYMAAVTADALVKSQRTGVAEDIEFGPIPDFYK